jgi:hypothetical protein
VPIAIIGVASNFDKILEGVGRLAHGTGTTDDYEAAGNVVGALLSGGASGSASKAGLRLGQTIRKGAVSAAEAFAERLGPELATASGPALGKEVSNADNLVLQSRGTGAKDTNPLPALDRTGKVHGPLPKAKDLDKYSTDELRQLLAELRQSVQQRIRRTVALGPDRAHGQRQGAEQALIRQIERNLEGRQR